MKSWKNSFYQEQANCEKLSQVIRDREADYQRALAHSRDVGDALDPVLDAFVPVEPAVDPPPSFLTRVKELGDKLNEYVQDSVSQTIGQVLASVQAHNPTLDLKPLGKAIPDECSQEDYQVLVEKLAPVTADYVRNITMAEEDNQ